MPAKVCQGCAAIKLAMARQVSKRPEKKRSGVADAEPKSKRAKYVEASSGRTSKKVTAVAAANTPKPRASHRFAQIFGSRAASVKQAIQTAPIAARENDRSRVARKITTPNPATGRESSFRPVRETTLITKKNAQKLPKALAS